jgi:hypothetical protein
MLANVAELPQASEEAIIRNLLDACKPTPESCNEHPVVSVHSVVPVYGPEIWNDPMLNE